MKKLLFASFVMGVVVTGSAYASEGDLAKELRMLKEQLKVQQQLINQQSKALAVLEKKLGERIESQGKVIAKLKSPEVKSLKGDIKVAMNPSLKVESMDGRYSFQPSGRMHIDYAAFDDDKNDHPDGATFRRMRLGFKGKVGEDVHYKAAIDFGNKDADDSASFKDVYLSYTGMKYAGIKVGNFKPAYGLEELTSSNHITFIERSLPTGSFVAGQIIGVQVFSGGENYSWAVGAHNDLSTTKSTDDEAKSVVARGTFAPIAESDRVVHIGLSGGYKVPDSAGDSVAFDSYAENSLQRLESAETGAITGVDSISSVGAELAAVYGPFSVQGEYFHNSVNRESLVDVDVDGWYAQASYFITGESRPYKAKSGIFGRVRPHNNFNIKNGGVGAVELAARYSNLDLNDGNVLQGGEVSDVTLAANWYLNPNTRLMANYILSDGDGIAPAGANVAADDDPNVLLLRAAIDF